MKVQTHKNILVNILNEEKHYNRGKLRKQVIKPKGRIELINFKRLANENSVNCIVELILLINLNHENILNKCKLKFLPNSLQIAVKAECDEHISSFQEVLKISRLQTRQIKFVMFQLFSLVNYFYFNGLVARSLNPKNIMISPSVNVYFVDFSSSRLQSFPHNYSKEYRIDVNYTAPEISLNLNLNFFASDIWSLGCILYEMIEGKPLFRVNNSTDYLRAIFKCLGSPHYLNDLGFIGNKGTIKWIRAQTIHEPRLASYWVHPSQQQTNITDLLDRCLKFDPRERISAQEALEHPFFVELYDPLEEREVLKKNIDHINFREIFKKGANKNELFKLLINVLKNQ